MSACNPNATKCHVCTRCRRRSTRAACWPLCACSTALPSTPRWRTSSVPTPHTSSARTPILASCATSSSRASVSLSPVSSSRATWPRSTSSSSTLRPPPPSQSPDLLEKYQHQQQQQQLQMQQQRPLGDQERLVVELDKQLHDDIGKWSAQVRSHERKKKHFFVHVIASSLLEPSKLANVYFF